MGPANRFTLGRNAASMIKIFDFITLISQNVISQKNVRNFFQNKRGELQLSLCYQPIEGVLNLGVVQGRNMKSMDLNGTSGKSFF